MQSQRFGRLDSVRGLAALTVAIFHSMHVFGLHGFDRIYLLRFYGIIDAQVGLVRIILSIFNGNAAVSLFFVISGFVLGHSIRRNSHYWPATGLLFLIKRMLRLYPTLAVALIVYFAFGWFAWSIAPTFIEPPSWVQLTTNLLLFSPDLVGATWSIFVEIGIAPLFILAALIIRRYGVTAQLALLTGAIIWLFLSSNWLRGPWLYFPLNQSFFLFMIGSSLTFAEPMISKIKPTKVSVLLLAGFVTLGFARGTFGYNSRWSLLLEGIGSAVIVGLTAYVTSARILGWLDGRLVRWLGRISYSFYLYHPLVLTLFVLPFVSAAGAATLPLAPLAAGCLVVILTLPPTLVLAYASYRWLEVPTMSGSATIDAYYSTLERNWRTSAKDGSVSNRLVAQHVVDNQRPSELPK